MCEGTICPLSQIARKKSIQEKDKTKNILAMKTQSPKRKVLTRQQRIEQDIQREWIKYRETTLRCATRNLKIAKAAFKRKWGVKP